MRNYKYLILILILSACNGVDNKPIDENFPQEYKVKNPPKTDCILGEEKLDNELTWTSSVINPEFDYENYVLLSAHISANDSNFGIISMMNKTDSLATLFLVESKDNSNNYLIKGTKNIGRIGKYYTVQSLCSSDCKIETYITGLICVDSTNSTKTIDAWTVDNDNGRLLRVNKDKVTCTDSFNTEYD